MEATTNFESKTCRRAGPKFSFEASVQTATRRKRHTLTYLEALESESIHILREVAAESGKPALLFSEVDYDRRDLSLLCHAQTQIHHRRHTRSYTRNMVTGASTASLAVVLLDARKGVLTQPCRHVHIVSLLGIPHLVVAINNMDLVGYSQDVFETIREAFGKFAAGLQCRDIIYIPISVLKGNMVVECGENLSWYHGPASFIPRILHRVDIHTLQAMDGVSQLQMNDIARVGIKAQLPLVFDSYSRNRATGSFIVIDEADNNTVAAGMIV